MAWEDCPYCYGSGGGREPELACPHCRGSGLVRSPDYECDLPDPEDNVWEPMTMNDLPWLGGPERNYDVKE